MGLAPEEHRDIDFSKIPGIEVQENVPAVPFYNCECNLKFKPTSEKSELFKKYAVPFVCSECGSLKFPYEALNGVVFIWPEPVTERTAGGVLLPQNIQENFRTAKGIVLSSGPGVISEKTGVFQASTLQPGDEVLYDRSVPWKTEVVDSKGNKREVIINNLLDITAKIL